jgi:hypothetical protein
MTTLKNTIKSHRTGVSTFANLATCPDFSGSHHISQILHKDLPIPKKKEFRNIFSIPSQKIKIPHTKANRKKIVKVSIDYSLQLSWTIMQAYYSIYKKLAIQWLNEALCTVSSFTAVGSLVLRNRQLLVTPKQ